MRVESYSNYLTRICGLTGQATTADATILGTLNGYFNRYMRQAWETTMWPDLCPIQSRTPSSSFISYEQSGQDEIDVVFEVYATNPLATAQPRRVGWTSIPDGIQLIGQTSDTAVYVHFRKRVPEYRGDAYSAGTAYAVGDQILFTETSGAKNYYRCTTATTAGQSPETHAAKWSRRDIPHLFFEYVIQGAYSDWLRADGKRDEAARELAVANELLANALDKIERQQRFIPNPVYLTHLNSRPSY